MILPHFTDQQLPNSQRWASQHGMEVLGLPESVGLRCADGQATVVGDGELLRISGNETERISTGRSFPLATSS